MLEKLHKVTLRCKYVSEMAVVGSLNHVHPQLSDFKLKLYTSHDYGSEKVFSSAQRRKQEVNPKPSVSLEACVTADTSMQ